MQPAFQRSRYADLATQTIAFTEDLISNWAEGDEISIELEMARVTIQVIVRTMMGVELDEADTDRILDQLEPIGAQFEPSIKGFVLPEWIPSQERRAFNRAVSELEAILQEILDERRETSLEEMDVASILLRNQRDLGDVDDDLLRDEMMTMLLAGHDTTELMLTYAWYLLAKHPEMQTRLYEEVDTAFDEADTPLEALDELEFTKRVLQETLRLYPPVYAIFREVRLDTRVCGYRLPEGAVVLLPQWVMHRDSRWYDNPETFDPDRWLRTPQHERRTGQYFPFGAGAHFCIGRKISLIEAQTILATIAQRYTLELGEEGHADLDLRPAITLHPRNPLKMTIRERR
jgi:cytochrome P450